MNTIIQSIALWGSQWKTQDSLCEACGIKPKYIEQGFQHPYCGKTCARSLQGKKSKICLFRGCRASGHETLGGYCSDSHHREAVRHGQAMACNECKVYPQAVSNLCHACERRVRIGPRLKELDIGSVTFKTVKDRFSSEWSATGEVPKVKKIYEIRLSRETRAKSETYRKNHQSDEEIHTYHASQCICDLGVKEAVLCDIKACGICTIVRSSFKEFAFGIPHNIGRFGEGIYSYKNPAKADEFATSCLTSPYRLVIANNVLVKTDGKRKRPLTGPKSPRRTEPVFVSSADAITPTHVILYTK